jgi:hypothetical protein
MFFAAGAGLRRGIEKREQAPALQTLAPQPQDAKF